MKAQSSVQCTKATGRASSFSNTKAILVHSFSQNDQTPNKKFNQNMICYSFGCLPKHTIKVVFKDTYQCTIQCYQVWCMQSVYMTFPRSTLICVDLVPKLDT